MDDVAGDGREGAEGRHLTRLASGRLLRLVRGLIKKRCPTVNWDCYWCGHQLYMAVLDGRESYVGDNRVMHHPACPWVEVIEYKQTEMFDGRSEARVPEGDDGAAGGDLRPTD